MVNSTESTCRACGEASWWRGAPWAVFRAPLSSNRPWAAPWLVLPAWCVVDLSTGGFIPSDQEGWLLSRGSDAFRGCACRGDGAITAGTPCHPLPHLGSSVPCTSPMSAVGGTCGLRMRALQSSLCNQSLGAAPSGRATGELMRSAIEPGLFWWVPTPLNQGGKKKKNKSFA